MNPVALDQGADGDSKQLLSDIESDDSMHQLFMDESAAGIPKSEVQMPPSPPHMYYAFPSLQVDYIVPSTGMLQGESDASFRMRKMQNLSASFPGTALHRAMHPSGDSDSDSSDPLSRSCGALPTVKTEVEGECEDLRDLAWLQKKNLLKNIPAGEDSGTEADSPQTEMTRVVNQAPSNRHPPNVPYNPLIHTNTKPNLSFSALIFMAIESSAQHSLPVRDIYKFIQHNFPYFETAPNGWKNSVRHNLSLNKSFKRMPRDKGQGVGKGSLWSIEESQRHGLIQTILRSSNQYNRSPTTLHQLLGIQRHVPTGPTVRDVQQLISPRGTPNLVSRELLPHLSQRLENLASVNADMANLCPIVADETYRTNVACEALLRMANCSDDDSPTYELPYQLPYQLPSTVTPHPYMDHAYSLLELDGVDQDSESDKSSGSVDEGYAQVSSDDTDSLASLQDVPEDGTRQYQWDEEDDEDSESSASNQADEVDGEVSAGKARGENDDLSLEKGARMLMFLKTAHPLPVPAEESEEETPRSPKTPKNAKSPKQGTSTKTNGGSARKRLNSRPAAVAKRQPVKAKPIQRAKGGKVTKETRRVQKPKSPRPSSSKDKAPQKVAAPVKEEPSSSPPQPQAPGSKGFNGPLILQGKRASTSPYAGNREKKARREPLSL